jgi:hypothetical protein
MRLKIYSDEKCFIHSVTPLWMLVYCASILSRTALGFKVQRSTTQVVQFLGKDEEAKGG